MPELRSDGVRSLHIVCIELQYTTHRIRVWDIYLHLVDVYGKCKKICHEWILWAILVLACSSFSNYLQRTDR